MNINLENVKFVLVAIVMLATAVERGIELFRPWLLKIKVIEWQNVVKLGAAIVLGFCLSALIKLDVLAMLGLTYPPVAGYAAAGVLASAGASTWHAVLEWLKTIRR